MRKAMLAWFFGVRECAAGISGRNIRWRFSLVKQLATQFFLVAPTLGAVQNVGHFTVILPIQERSI